MTKNSNLCLATDLMPSGGAREGAHHAEAPWLSLVTRAREGHPLGPLIFYAPHGRVTWKAELIPLPGQGRGRQVVSDALLLSGRTGVLSHSEACTRRAAEGAMAGGKAGVPQLKGLRFCPRLLHLKVEGRKRGGRPWDIPALQVKEGRPGAREGPIPQEGRGGSSASVSQERGSGQGHEEGTTMSHPSKEAHPSGCCKC